MSSKDLERWAKTTELPDPVRWGEIEARILLEPGPSPEESAELEKLFPQRSFVRRILRWLLVGVLVLPEAVVLLGSSAIGLGFVVAYMVYDRELPGGFDWALQGLFVAATCIAVTPVLLFLSEKRRGWGYLAISGGTGLASGGSFVLLATTSRSLIGVWPSLQFLALIAGAVGLVSFVFLLLVGKPPPRTRLGERLRVVPPEEMWIRGKRAVVLEQFRKRGLLNSADSTAIMGLPVGAWGELESLPDGRVVRHL